MLIQTHNFEDAFGAMLDEIEREKMYALDTETHGIWWWRSRHVPWYEPKVFSIQVSTAKSDYYFDFRDSLPDSYFKHFHDELTQREDWLCFIQNAKFDMHQLANHGVLFENTVHCTKSTARIVNNIEPKCNLDTLSECYLGAKKDDVISLIKESGFSTPVLKLGDPNKAQDWLHFDKLPLDALVSYGEKDTRLCYDLGVFQLQRIMALKEKSPKILDVLYNEYDVTKVLFDMEREGVQIDIAYTEEAYAHEIAEYKRLEGELNRLADPESVSPSAVDWNSAKQLKPIFERLGEPYGYTEKGNASFDAEALEDSESQLAKSILKYRYHYKRAHTYFENFLWLADDNGVLHADFQQNGTQYARMSSWDPNLFNIPKAKDKEESKYKVRKCFKVFEGTVLMDIDYKGAEYYMAMDYAREMPIIEELKAGVDPHARLAQELDLKDRQYAKTMQFRIIYGGGKAAVGRALGLRGADAERIGGQKKAEYFRKAPALAALLEKIKRVAGHRGHIINWLGRVLYYDWRTSYKAPNGLIQSGVGDMTKVAMVRLHKGVLKGKKTKMLIQIYDAILFKLDPSEVDLIPEIKRVMAEVYPHKLLPMKVDVGYSKTSWDVLQDAL